ncbi:dihydrolipoamide acetyltransferase family protein [[Acholeplasma] multilocale]|uniref:dihydrolipoamide acetyltransferase family protein n=1 Tax=[Acholeplasma] multilocale TaxID=264638 RepID=UPI00040F44D2|nr:dihydrolipoamide acetyltransferase family protein [[Acholeplasma] multilocale]
MYKVKFTDIGEGLTEGKVTEVLVKIGDKVKMGDSLFHVETDKVNSEIPTPVDGIVSEILVSADQDINVGDVVFIINTQEGAVSAPVTETVVETPIKAREENASVVGSTPVSNEVIKRDVSVKQKNDTSLIRSTPVARVMAAENNVDLSLVRPTGPGDRILIKDIQTYLDSLASKVESTMVKKSDQVIKIKEEPFIPKNDSTIDFYEKPLTGMRKAISKAMTYSHTENAAFTGMSNVDITSTFDLRTELKQYAIDQNIKLTYLAFIVKAVSKTLLEMPGINVQLNKETNSIKYINLINIGIAVDTPDGLVVPVIKNANHLSLFQIAQEISSLASKARDKKLTMADMSGGTFTISNFGSVGLDYATPIINSPESAILGVGTMTKQPTYIGDELVPRYIMPFSITCDHRIIDGADAGRFIQKLESFLDNPVTLLV